LAIPPLGRRPAERVQAGSRVDLNAGWIKDDDSDLKMLGLGLQYRLTPAATLSGRTGLAAADNLPQGMVRFGLKLSF